MKVQLDHVFLVSRAPSQELQDSLVEENRMYGDILQVDVIEATEYVLVCTL